MKVRRKRAVNCMTMVLLLFTCGMFINLAFFRYTIKHVRFKELTEMDKVTFVPTAERVPQVQKNNKTEQKAPEIPVVKNPDNGLPLCPEKPPKLVGKMAVNPDSKKEELAGPKELEVVRYGGLYTPTECNARERVAIIVPYRDRAEHLDIFLYHMHTVLQRQQLEYGIYVVEMAFPAQFNRGLLANVGYLTAKSVKDYTCYVIHDVDLLPSNDENLYRCYDSPCHMSAANSKFNYKVPYKKYFGGVVSFTRKHFEKVNGFSNLYFGWGAEDDDLQRRATAAGLKLSRRNPEKGRYEALKHKKDAANPPNPNRVPLLQHAVTRMSKEGLNSMEYTRLGLEFRPLYTWIYVKVDEVEIIKKFEHLIKPGKKAVMHKPKHLTIDLPRKGLSKTPGKPANTQAEKKPTQVQATDTKKTGSENNSAKVAPPPINVNVKKKT